MSEPNAYTYISDAAGFAEYEPGRVKPVSVLKSTGANIVVFAFDTGTELREHTAHQPVILQALEGSLTVQVDGAVLTLKPGDLLHIEPHVQHSVTAAEHARLQLTVLMIDSLGPTRVPLAE